MSRLTVFLARAIGLFTVVLVVVLLVRGSAIIQASVGDGPVTLVYATISLAMGIAMAGPVRRATMATTSVRPQDALLGSGGGVRWPKARPATSWRIVS